MAGNRFHRIQNIVRSLILCSIFTFLLNGCNKKSEEPAGQPEVSVSLYVVEPQAVPTSLEVIGVAESSHLVEIRTRVEGYIDLIAYREGGLVEPGQLMFIIDPRPFIVALENANAEAARQKALLWNAKQSVDRMVPLYRQNAASKRDLDNAVSTALATEASLMSAEAQVKQAELNLNYTTIRSPIRGLASKSKFRVGTLVTPGDNGLLTTISMLDPIWVNFSVSEMELLKNRSAVEEGKLINPPDMNFEVTVVLADGSNFPYKGKVDFAEPFYDQRTGTVSVRSTFPNPQYLLQPGQFVRVRISGSVMPNAIVIPQRSVLQGQKGLFVYVVGQDGKAQVRPVITGNWYGNYWVIASGLNPGDEVILDGINKVQQGSPLKITERVSTPDFQTTPLPAKQQ